MQAAAGRACPAALPEGAATLCQIRVTLPGQQVPLPAPRRGLRAPKELAQALPIELVSDPAAHGAPASLAARHVAAFRAAGTGALIANAACEVLLLRHQGRELPVTVDDGRRGLSYVSSPHSTYVLYPRDEIALLGFKHLRPAAEAVLALVAGLIRLAALNRAVHLDNWLLSTNLHGNWDGSGLAAMRAGLAARYPDHALIIRSLDCWSCPALLAAVREDGWVLLPARQVWVIDDLARDWLSRSHTRADARALRRSGLTLERPAQIAGEDAARIAELYRQLYLARYSPINPCFTPAFITASAESGLLHYNLLRDGAGKIMAFAALRCAGDIGTVPLMGYDTVRPQREALYRIASHAAMELALERALRFHGSAGAGQFKRNRGARGVIEYMAIDARHLSPIRRAALAVLAAGLNRFMVPLLTRRGW